MKPIWHPSVIVPALSFLTTLGPSGSPHASTAPTSSKSSLASEVLNKTSRAFHDVARKGMPAVVGISAVKIVSSKEDGTDIPVMSPDTPPGVPDSPSFDQDLFGMNNDKQIRRTMSIGSGVIIRPDGLVLTNNHVVEGAEKITVSFDEKRKSTAQVVGTDPKTDLAIIRVNGNHKNLPTLEFGDSEKIKVGDWAIAIGSPFGLNQSVSFGIISAKGRARMGILDIEDFIQTDAAINPGSSGGPLLNSDGEIIGVNTAIFSQGNGFVGIGFAIPSKIAKEIGDQLMANGKVTRGWIGVTAQDLEPDLALFFKAQANHGALVSEVLSEGPAGNAKLQPGDVITRYGGNNVIGAVELKSMVGRTRAGSSIELEFMRNGRKEVRAVVIREQPQPPGLRSGQQAGIAAKSDQRFPLLGLTLQDLPLEIGRLLKLVPNSGAMVVGVQTGSPAFDAGIAPGDVILNANHHKIRGATDFAEVTRKLGNDGIAVLYVQRGQSEKIFVPVKAG